ncbi:unnamed protein product, partial [Mycena citricolor]
SDMLHALGFVPATGLPDFLAEKPLFQVIIEKEGHKCFFLPKFHCELNPIEMVWGQAKQYFRQFSDGTFPKAKTLVPEALNQVTGQHYNTGRAPHPDVVLI